MPAKAIYCKPMEVLLCVFLHVEQNEAADTMGISRKPFWDDLQKARQKMVDTLVNEKPIEISGESTLIAANERSNSSAKDASMGDHSAIEEAS